MAGVRVSRQAGLDPVKINCVLLRGFNAVGYLEAI